MTTAPKPRDIQWYGLKADLPDRRDKVFAAKPSTLPASVDLRKFCCPVMDQDTLGCCGPHGVIAALRYGLLKAGHPDHAGSRLQLYYDARAVEGCVSSDSGTEIRDVIKCAAKIGVAHENLWPYVIKNFKRKPTKSVYTDALKFAALTYERVEIGVQPLKAALAAGFPVVIGINVFQAFESDAVAQSGILPMPGAADAPLGGHCMLAVGYGQKSGYFTVQNSWNTDWGDKGFCYIPEDYLGSPDLGSDYWTITDIKVS